MEALPDALKQLPAQINNPVAVMKSAPQATQQGYVVLTELVEENNGKQEPVVSALHLKRVNSGLEVINIASVYGKNLRGLQGMLNSDLLYWHKTKGSHFLDAFGLQLPAKIASSDVNQSVGNIKTEADLSQYQKEKGSRFLENFALSSTHNGLHAELRSSLSDGGYLSERNIKTEADLRQYQNGEMRFSVRRKLDNAAPKRTASGYDEARAIVTDLLGEPLTNRGTGMVATISKRSLDKLVSGKAVNKSSNVKGHLTAVANIDNLFEDATLGWTDAHKNADPNIAGVHRLFAPLNFDGVMKLVKLMVKEMAFNQGNRIYSVETIEVDNGDLSLSWKPAPSENAQYTSQQTANVESLIEEIENFNKRNDGAEARFSRRPKIVYIDTLPNKKRHRMWGLGNMIIT